MTPCLRSKNAIAAAVLSISPFAALAAAPELRGTWLTTTGYSTGQVKDAATTNSTYQRLRTVGLNSAYMDSWRGGYTQYPSATLQSVIGVDRDPALGTRDLFQDTLIQAHRNGMAQIGWFQYGFATFFGNPNGAATPLATYAQQQGWLLQDSAGNYTNATYKFSWMNPANPAVRSFLINIVTDAVKKYDLDGVQFDDRLAWPVDFGYDTYTKNLYLAETGNTVPANQNNAAFVAWRAGKVTEFAKQLEVAVKQINPNVLVCAAPSTYSTAYNSYCADWSAWSNASVTVGATTLPLFDEIIPQVYNSSASGFSSSWNAQVAVMNPTRRADFGAGISINNSAGAAYDWTTINQPQVNAVRATTGVAGHIWWYSAGVLNNDEAALTAYYNVAANGQAPRTDQSATYRRAPVVATPLGGNTYAGTIPETGFYEIIYRVGNTWTLFDTRQFGTAAGATFNIGTAADAVELLIDRRPASLINPKWKVASGGNWSAIANWSGGVPNFQGAIAQLTSAINTNRTINLDVPVIVGSLTFDNTNRYTLTGSSLTLSALSGSNATVSIITGSHTITSPMTLASNTAIDVPTTLTTAAISGSANLTKLGAGTLAAASIRIGTLAISSGAITIASNGTANGTSRLTGAPVIAPTATLDLNDNDLVIDYSGANPLNTIRAQIATGYHDGAWDGTGGITSSSARNEPNSATALGYANSADIFGIAPTETDTFSGQTVDGSTTLIKYTWVGDADLSGAVDQTSDLTLYIIGLNSGGSTWYEGDFNYDGLVDQTSDLTLYIIGLNAQSGSLGGGSDISSVVPEPCAMAIILLAAPSTRRRFIRRAASPRG